MIFGKKLVNIKLLSETFLIARRIRQNFSCLSWLSSTDGTAPERQSHETTGLGLKTGLCSILQ